MRQAILALLLLAALLAPLPAQAVLTDAEKADVQSLVLSSGALRDAEAYLTSAIALRTTPETRPLLRAALAEFHLAQIEHWRVLAFLLHTGTENPTPKPDLTPEQWHTSAWFHHDRYVLALDRIAAALATAQGVETGHAAYQDALRRAKDIWLPTAKAKALTMDRALSYLAPWPALRDGTRPDGAPFTIEAVVGPHGDYRRMQWFINRGKNYTMDAYGGLIAAYALDADPTAINSAWTQSSNVLDGLDTASALLVGVTFTAEQANEDAFCRVLRVRKILGVTVAQRYQAWGSVLASLLPPGPLVTAVSKLMDSWKHAVDLSMWAGDVFPESARCSSPFLAD